MELLSVAKCLFIAFFLTRVAAMEVYLRQLTVYTSHESSFLSDNPEVYLVCEDDREPLMLRHVVDVNKAYEFAAEEIPVTHLAEGACVVCTLKEFDLLDRDDTYGTMKLCEEGFHNGFSEVRTNGEFYAQFECPLCKMNYEAHQLKATKKHHHSIHTNSHTSATVFTSSSVNAAEMHEKQGMSSGGVALLSSLVFLVGLAVGVIAVLLFVRRKGSNEAARMRELNSILSQTQVPFDALPKGKEKSSQGTLKAGVASYEPVSTDDTPESL